jgi:hypothetical protein
MGANIPGKPRVFMPGMTALMQWKADERLMPMIASHLSSGKSSIGETCWMPALLTRMSTEPQRASASATMARISDGSSMLAAL